MASLLLDGKKSNALVAKLSGSYKNVHYYLDFKTPTDLLVAAILSAQTRDEVVNRITPNLFKQYKTAKDYANADSEELAMHIKSVSFAGNKAKNIVNACRTIVEEHKGNVPDSMEDLIALPGIGRKTANTILINAYGIVNGIPVDTWVIKLSHRMGLSASKDPEKIEEDLKSVVPKRYWSKLAYVLKAHGKAICQTTPYCSKCPINRICPKNGVTKRL